MAKCLGPTRKNIPTKVKMNSNFGKGDQQKRKLSEM